MSSTPEPNESTRVAIAELTAAQRLLADPQVAVDSVAVHVRRALEVTQGESLLAEAIERYVEPQEREQQQQVARWLTADDAADGEAPSRAAMRLQIGALRSMLGDETVTPDPTAHLGMLFLALVAMSLMGAGFYGLIRAATGPWRVHWFPEAEFKGTPRTEQVRTIDFHWEDSPARGIPKDDWSARMETCLELDAETKVRFKLTSDDGSRLYVDGDKIIDNWGTHAVRSRSGRKTLDAGVHHVAIEFFEARFKAALKLEAAFDEDEDYGPIPVSMLDVPNKGGSPCGDE